MKINASDIKNFREKHRLTQAELAELLGVSTRTVQHYENERVIPKSKQGLFQSVFSSYPLRLQPHLSADIPGTETAKDRIIALQDEKIKMLEEEHRRKLDVIIAQNQKIIDFMEEWDLSKFFKQERKLLKQAKR